MIRYSHYTIAHGKAISEAFSLALAFSDRVTRKSFFYYPNRKI